MKRLNTGRKLQINLDEAGLVPEGSYSAIIEAVDLKEWENGNHISFRVRFLDEEVKGTSKFKAFNIDDEKGFKFFGWALKALGLSSLVEPVMDDSDNIIFAELEETGELDEEGNSVLDFTGTAYSLTDVAVEVTVKHSNSSDGRTFDNITFKSAIDDLISVDLDLEDDNEEESII